jgi:hypothetical protein
VKVSGHVRSTYNRTSAEPMYWSPLQITVLYCARYCTLLCKVLSSSTKADEVCTRHESHCGSRPRSGTTCSRGLPWHKGHGAARRQSMSSSLHRYCGSEHEYHLAQVLTAAVSISLCRHSGSEHEQQISQVLCLEVYRAA